MNTSVRSTRDRPATVVATTAVFSVAAVMVVGQLYATVGMRAELASAFDTPAGATTWTSTVFGLAYAVCMLVAGPLSDVFGRRRVAASGLVGSAVIAILITAAPNFELLLVGRIVQGGVAALFPTVALVYLTEQVNVRWRSVAVSTVVSAYIAAAVVAPIAAQLSAAVLGWRSWFFISALALVLLAGLLMRIMVDESPGRRVTGPAVTQHVRAVPRLVTRPRLAALYLASVCAMFAFVGLTTLLQIAGPGTADDPAATRMIRICTLPACVLAPLVITVLGRVPGRRRLAPTMAVLTGSALAVGYSTGPVSLAITLGLVTLALAIAGPSLVEMIASTGPRDERGAATAIYGFALFLGASLAAPAANAVAQSSFRFGAVVLALAAAFGTVAALCVLAPDRRVRSI